MKPLLYERVTNANPFVNETTPFAIDPETLKKCWNLRTLPELPQMAVLPFKHTWLELDRGKLAALCTGTKDTLVMSFFDKVDVDVPIIVMVFRDGERRAESGFIEQLDATIDVRRFPPAVTKALVRQAMGDTEPMPYEEKIAVCTFEAQAKQLGDGEIMQAMTLWLTQYRGIARAVMTVLAAIAYGPTRKTEMAPSGRWLAKQRHGYKSVPFVKHTVVQIEMEEKLLYHTLRNEGVEHARRAEHDVRSHPRRIRKGRPDEYTIIVSAHKRGDPSIGRIIHDGYETTRTERLRDEP